MQGIAHCMSIRAGAHADLACMNVARAEAYDASFWRSFWAGSQNAGSTPGDALHASMGLMYRTALLTAPDHARDQGPPARARPAARAGCSPARARRSRAAAARSAARRSLRAGSAAPARPPSPPARCARRPCVEPDQATVSSLFHISLAYHDHQHATHIVLRDLQNSRVWAPREKTWQSLQARPRGVCNVRRPQPLCLPVDRSMGRQAQWLLTWAGRGRLCRG